VDDLLSQLNSKFSSISSELLAKSEIGTFATQMSMTNVISGRHVAEIGQPRSNYSDGRWKQGVWVRQVTVSRTRFIVALTATWELVV
jgi:hypothetical protein